MLTFYSLTRYCFMVSLSLSLSPFHPPSFSPSLPLSLLSFLPPFLLLSLCLLHTHIHTIFHRCVISFYSIYITCTNHSWFFAFVFVTVSYSLFAGYSYFSILKYLSNLSPYIIMLTFEIITANHTVLIYRPKFPN